jgi:hypothetical protein
MTSTGALTAAVPPSAGTPHPVPPPRRADEAADPVFTVNAGALVLPAAIRAGHQLDGPRFADDVWDIRGFLPRSAKMTRIDFTTIADPCHARTIREYLHSRINRGVAVNQLSGTARPMKITSLYQEFAEVRLILRDLAAAGAARLADVTPRQLEEVLAGWKRRPDTAAGKVGVVKYLAAHGPFLTDRLGFTPWPGRPANQIATWEAVPLPRQSRNRTGNATGEEQNGSCTTIAAITQVLPNATFFPPCADPS